MRDPVQTPPQSLVDQAAQAGAAARVSQVTVGVITPDSTNLITPRAPRDIRPTTQQKTQQVLQGARDTIRAAIRGENPPPEPVVVVPPVDLPSSTDIPASLLGSEPPAPITEPVPPLEVGKDPKAAHAWALARKEASDAKKALEAALAEVNSVKSEATKQAELAVSLKKERDEIEAQLQKTNLLESPAFKARYDGRIAEQRALLTNTFAQVLEPAQVESLVNQVLTSPPKEFGELLGKVPAWAQQLVLTTRATIQQTASEREKAVTEWRTTRVALAEQEARDGHIKLVTELESETAKGVENAVKMGNYMLKQTGDPAWDAKVAERITKAKAVLAQPRSRQDIVDVFVEGVTAAETRAELAKVYQENAALKSQLTRLGARPASAVVPAGTPPPPPPPAAKPAKMRDFVKEAMNGISGR